MEFDDRTIEQALFKLQIIAEERNRILEKLKEALLNDDYTKVKEFANQLCQIRRAFMKVIEFLRVSTKIKELKIEEGCQGRKKPTH